MKTEQAIALIDHGASIALYLGAGGTAIALSAFGQEATALWTFIAGGGAVQAKSGLVSSLKKRQHQ